MPRYDVLLAPVANNTMPPGSRFTPFVVIVAVPANQSIVCTAVAPIGLATPVDKQPVPKRPITIAGFAPAGALEPDTASWTMLPVLVLAVICTSQHSEAGAPRKTNGTSNR